MAAKDVQFGTDARNRMLNGVNIMEDAVKVPLRQQGRTVAMDTPLSARRITHTGI